MSDQKLYEVRTRRLPQGIDIYGYVTKGKPYLHKNQFGYQVYRGNIKAFLNRSEVLNGKIPFKFQIGEVIAYEWDESQKGYFPEDKYFLKVDAQWILNKAHLSREEVHAYGKGKTIYFHEIKNLQIFDKPMALGEFYKMNPFTPHVDVNNLGKYFTDYISLKSAQMLLNDEKLTKAPQSYQFVWVRE